MYNLQDEWTDTADQKAQDVNAVIIGREVFNESLNTCMILLIYM